MKLKIVSLGLLCLLASTQIVAQEKVAPKTATVGKFVLGYANFPNSDLQVFTPQLEAPTAEHFYFGVANGGMSENMVYFLNLVAALGGTSDNDSMKAQYSGLGITLDLGYCLVNNKKYKLYPLVGAGTSFYYVNIDQKADLNLGQVQQNFGRSINMNRLGFALDVSMNIDISSKWKYSEETKRHQSFLYGLKIGYHYQFAGDNWKYDGGGITGTPKYGMQGFYVGICIGGISTERL